MKFDSPRQLKELAELIDAEIIGDSNITVTGLSDISPALPGDITFADNDKYLTLALSGPASVVIVPKTLALPQSIPSGKALLCAQHAQDALNQIASVVFSHLRPAPAVGIHSTAIVASSAKISDDCSIGAYCVVGNNVSIGIGTCLGANVVIEDSCIIGEACEIGAQTVIHQRCLLGDRVIVQSGCQIGTEPFYYYQVGEEHRLRNAFGSVEIAADVELGAGCTIDRGISRNTFIGLASKLDNQIHVGHDVHIGSRVTIAAQTGIAGYVWIEDDVIIRGQVGILQHIKVGKGAEVLAKSGVAKDVFDNKLVFGIPTTTKDRYIEQRRFLRKRIRKLEQDAELSLGTQREFIERVLQTIANETGEDRSKIWQDKSIEELNLDSLDRIQLRMGLEDEFGLEDKLDDHSLDNIKTINDIVYIIRRYYSGKSSHKRTDSSSMP